MAAVDPTALTAADQAEIDRQTNASIQPQVDALNAAKAAYDAHQAAVRSDIGSFTTAAGKMVEPIGGNIAGAYNTAATNTAAFGKGFSDGLQAVMTANQSEADRALTLGGQTQAIGQTDKIVNPGAGATDAFYAVHGYNPAAALSAESAAKSAEGYAQPGLMAARGQNLIFAAVKAAEAGDKDFQDQITKLWATAPQLRSQITASIQQLHLSNAQYQHGVEQDTINTGLRKKEIANTALATQAVIDDRKAKNDLAKKKFVATTATEAARIKLLTHSADVEDQKLGIALANARGLTPDGVPAPGNKWNATHTAVVKDPAQTHTASSTAAGKAASVRAVNAQWQNLNRDAKKLVTTSSIDGTVTYPVDAQTAFNNLYKEYSTILTPYGVTSAKISSQVRAALRLAGFKRTPKGPGK